MPAYDDDVQNCVQTLQRGGTVLYPTDTIWGIGCDAMQGQAAEKIYLLKRRKESKSMIILLASANDVGEYFENVPPLFFEMDRSAERPTTFVLPRPKNFPKNMVQPDGTVAVRIVKEPFCRALINALGRPIVSTSANISGQAAPKNFAGISPHILSGVDYVTRYRQGESAPALPSRIVKIDGENAETLRE